MTASLLCYSCRVYHNTILTTFMMYIDFFIFCFPPCPGLWRPAARKCYHHSFFILIHKWTVLNAAYARAYKSTYIQELSFIFKSPSNKREIGTCSVLQSWEKFRSIVVETTIVTWVAVRFITVETPIVTRVAVRSIVVETTIVTRVSVRFIIVRFAVSSQLWEKSALTNSNS